MSKNYKLTFEENFKNGSLNWESVEQSQLVKKQEKSKTETIPSFVNNGEEKLRDDIVVRYAKENVTFEDGKLVLKAVAQKDGFAGACAKYKGRKFGKGLLEVKARFPKNMPGIWPKLSLHLENGIACAEVEFAQVKGISNKGKNYLALYAYFIDEFGSHVNEYLHSGFARWPSYYPPIDNDEKLAEGWHTFGYEQTDIDGIFYIDGLEIMRYDIDHPLFAVFDAEGELNITLGINRPQTEGCDENTELPCAMEVESVRFYEEV